MIDALNTTLGAILQQFINNAQHVLIREAVHGNKTEKEETDIRPPLHLQIVYLEKNRIGVHRHPRTMFKNDFH